MLNLLVSVLAKTMLSGRLVTLMLTNLLTAALISSTVITIKSGLLQLTTHQPLTKSTFACP